MNLWKNLLTWTCLALSVAGFVASTFAADPPTQVADHAPIAFDGEKTAWHGFDRYDFLMDENTLAIKPMKAEDDEKDGIKHQVQGQRR